MKAPATTKHTRRYTHPSLAENTKAEAGAICAENIIIKNRSDSEESSLHAEYSNKVDSLLVHNLEQEVKTRK
ncbi:hypothetical protein HZB90_03325 [archaeon]|nr:hypothetical protein [archaeon]